MCVCVRIIKLHRHIIIYVEHTQFLEWVWVCRQTVIRTNGQSPACMHGHKKYSVMRYPGIEPGPHRWQRRILTTELIAHICWNTRQQIVRVSVSVCDSYRNTTRTQNLYSVSFQNYFDIRTLLKSITRHQKKDVTHVISYVRSCVSILHGPHTYVRM